MQNPLCSNYREIDKKTEKDFPSTFHVNNEWVDLGVVWGDRPLLFFCEILQFLLEEFSIIYSLYIAYI